MLTGLDDLVGQSISDAAVAFGTSLTACTTLDQCRDAFKASIQPHGFHNFACGEVDLRERGRSTIYICDWPDSWKQLYLSTDMFDHDPFFEGLKHTQRPFLMSELRKTKQFDPTALAAMDSFTEHGWSEALAIPLKRTEHRFGLITLYGNPEDLGKPVRDALGVMSVCLYEKARRIVPNLGVYVQLAGLTLREMDSLRLVARGLTDQAIGSALGISPSTAHQYIENAKQKLQTKTRAEVAALTVSLGLVEI